MSAEALRALGMDMAWPGWGNEASWTRRDGARAQGLGELKRRAAVARLLLGVRLAAFLSEKWRPA